MHKTKSQLQYLQVYVLAAIVSLECTLLPKAAFAQTEATESSEEAAPTATALPAAKKKKFKKSRLTHDSSEGVADRRKLLLTSGEDKTVDLDFNVEGGPNGITVGNPQIAMTTLVRVGEERKQIIFKPLKAGETSVTVRDPDGSIKLIFDVVVTGNNLLRRAGELRDLLRDIEGINIRVVGQKVVIDGEVLVPADYGRLLSVVTDKSYVDLVLNLATLSSYAIQILSKRIQEDINTFAAQVKTRVVNGMIFLEGTVDNADQARRAVEVARLYLPEVKPGNPLIAKDPTAQVMPARSLVVNFLVVNPPPPKKQEKLVRITVHFVELSKTYSKIFAFKWAPGFTSNPQISFGQSPGGEASASGTSFTGTISSLFPKLQSAQNAGYARVLKTGSLIVRSGQNAVIEEQTEYPYSTLGQNGQPVGQSKNVGLAVAVTPQILGQSEDIALDLDMSQSNVVGRAPAAGAAPISAVHKVKTKIYLKSNESAAVGGVSATTAGTDFNKDDPTELQNSGTTEKLFDLTRSKNYQKQKSQFVIFVTPQVIENASEGTEDLRKNFRIKVK